MDDLDRREAFLLAIFTNPDDDLPRLVFADWLEENGEGEAALRLRRQCEHKHQLPAGVFALRGFSTTPASPARPSCWPTRPSSAGWRSSNTRSGTAAPN